MRKALVLAASLIGLAVPAVGEPVPAAAPPAAAPAPAQQQRPNVLVWMLDDVGFAQLSSFGGLVETPNIDRVARMGLRYSNYHTAPVCSAARASFLSGRMPHSVGLGGHAAVARPFPGYNARIPPSAGSIADNLRAAGYATFALGKWDHLASEDMTPAGPFGQWPTGQGFDRFYGFLSADTDNWHPALVRDQAPVPRPAQDGYHLNRDLADQAIAMIGARRIAEPARPFMMYWATSTAHAPHHAPADWIARYRGRFDAGWDKAREQILARQKAQGLVARATRLAPRPETVPAWDSLTADEKRLYARQMEVFAASLAYADHEFGRILDFLEASGELANTIVVVTSDNGASAEGNRHGMFTEGLLGRGRQASLAENLAFLDRWGGPESYPHYAMGWAIAGNTPWRFYKQTTYEGGARVPLVLAWPQGIAARGEIRSQFVHVSDVAPTLLEAAWVPLAAMNDNVPQSPMEGTSFAYSFADGTAPARKGPQYVEMFGNKGLWDGKWALVTRHRLEPWDMATMKPLTAAWELYDLEADPGQANDLARRHPERVAAMSRLFAEQATRYQVEPIGNMGEGTMEMARKAREDFVRRRGIWRYPGPVSNIAGTLAPPIQAMSYRMSARLDLPSDAVSGPLFAAGGTLGGMALYLSAGRPVFAINTMAGESTTVRSTESLSAGASRIAMDFARGADGDARVTIRSEGRLIGEGTVPAAIVRQFGIFELFGVGIDVGTPVLRGAAPDVPFPGGIADIVFDFTPAK
jgi:arylsulfatase